jgi:hypothetical protein
MEEGGEGRRGTRRPATGTVVLPNPLKGSKNLEQTETIAPTERED